jgi:hypothetical protein
MLLLLKISPIGVVQNAVGDRCFMTLLVFTGGVEVGESAAVVCAGIVVMWLMMKALLLLLLLLLLTISSNRECRRRITHRGAAVHQNAEI